MQFPMAQQITGFQKQILYRLHSPAIAVDLVQGFNASGNIHIDRNPVADHIG